MEHETHLGVGNEETVGKEPISKWVGSFELAGTVKELEMNFE